MARAFISHSSPDDRYVQEFVQLVRSLGYDEVFNDSHTIEPDEEFWPRIERGIREADAFVVVLSHASVKSYWVDREVQFAREQGKKVIPVRIDDCKPPAGFSGRDIIDLRQGRGDRVKIAPSKLSRHAAKKFFGREDELALLDRAWADPGTHVLSVVAWGGVGKTSLVTEWVATRMVAKGWPGVERYFDWSFYSQGTGDSRQTSSDLFISAALTFFGDPDPVKGSPWDRGLRLAGLVRQHRTLLVLDGVEPLQYPPTDRSGQAGRLKDQALEALLQSLVQENTGLCVVTTREHLANIDGYPTQQEHKLEKLLLAAAIGLLRHLQIAGSDAELEAVWKDVGGHALTLQLLGRFLVDAHGGDIRKFRELKFEEADLERQGRSAFKVMKAYEKWLTSAGEEQVRELAVLRLMGLFDRPMRRDCFQALRAEPAIPGLTDALIRLKEPQVKAALTRLGEVELISEAADSLDAHPLIREYFGQQLQKDHPAAFKEAHSRLFDFLCKNTPHRPDTLEGLAPLYEAVTHGCLAGQHQKACDEVFFDRVRRGSDGFSCNRLGAIGADLAAAAAFFDVPWSQVSPNLRVSDQAWVLSDAAHSLRALGRLNESLQPTRAGLRVLVQRKSWQNAAIAASNLSELEATLGQLADAVTDARESITYADRSGDAGQRIINRTTAADALHQSGQRAEAGSLFADTERRCQESDPQPGLLHSLPGSRYCDWLLAPAERAGWQMLHTANLHDDGASRQQPDLVTICAEVERRAKITLQWWMGNGGWLLTIALDHLTLARVGLVRAILMNPRPQPSLILPFVATAVNGLRAAGAAEFLSRGLFTAAIYHFVRGEHDLARNHLAECQQIAERGPMPLVMADVHLHRARMFRDKTELAKAAELIRDLGYGRRNDELADAEDAAKNW